MATVLICSAGQIVIPVKKFLRTKGRLALRGKQCHLFAKRWIILLFRGGVWRSRSARGSTKGTKFLKIWGRPIIIT